MVRQVSRYPVTVQRIGDFGDHLRNVEDALIRSLPHPNNDQLFLGHNDEKLAPVERTLRSAKLVVPRASVSAVELEVAAR